MNRMWEILIPVNNRVGVGHSLAKRRAWKEKVAHMAGGLTEMPEVTGWWENRDQLYREPMSPIRIMCNRGKIKEIIDYTIKYYDQEAVLAYCISTDCIMKHKES